jgi:hypothetical protein
MIVHDCFLSAESEKKQKETLILFSLMEEKHYFLLLKQKQHQRGLKYISQFQERKTFFRGTNPNGFVSILAAYIRFSNQVI